MDALFRDYVIDDASYSISAARPIDDKIHSYSADTVFFWLTLISTELRYIKYTEVYVN